MSPDCRPGRESTRRAISGSVKRGKSFPNTAAANHPTRFKAPAGKQKKSDVDYPSAADEIRAYKFSLSSVWDDSLPDAEVLQKGRLVYGRNDKYNGASLNAIGAVEEGRIPLSAIYALFGAKGEHKSFIKDLFTDTDVGMEWHHLGKKANEVYWQNRDEYEYPITDVTVFAALNYKQGVSDDALGKVIEIDKSVAHKIGAIAKRIEQDNTKVGKVKTIIRVKDEKIGEEYSELKREMRKKYLRVSTEEWSALRAKKNELANRMYSYKEVEVEKKVRPSSEELNKLIASDPEAKTIIDKAKRDILDAFGRSTPSTRNINAEAGSVAINKLVTMSIRKSTHFSIGKKAREDAKALILKKRPDIGDSMFMSSKSYSWKSPIYKRYVKETGEKVGDEFDVSKFNAWLQQAAVADIVDEIGKFATPKEQKAALHWFIKGAIRLPEDAPKVTEAIKYGERAKGKANTDPMSYGGPMAMMDALHEFKPKAKPINPDKVPQLSDKREMGYGVTTYLVQDDREGQQAMREIINTHWGEDANPWCLLHGDGYGHLSDGTNGGYDAWHYWNHYNALPKRVAFKNGKLLAFMATDQDDSDSRYQDYLEDNGIDESELTYEEWEDRYNEGADEQWWDRKDASHEGIPLGNIPVPNDPYGRWADFEIRDGEMKQVGGCRKGNRGEDGFTEWNVDGSIHSIKRGKFYAEYGLNFEDGSVPNFVRIDDSGEGTYDGKYYSYSQLRESDNADIVAKAERIYRENAQKREMKFEIGEWTQGNGSNEPLTRDILRSRLQKVREADNAEIGGDEFALTGDYNVDAKTARDWAKDNIRGTYTNNDSGVQIIVDAGKKRGGIKKVLSHSVEDKAHLQSVAAIPQIIEKSILLGSLPNSKKTKEGDAERYDYYACGLKIGNEDYVVKSVISINANGERYYDHALTEIEKGKLIDEILVNNQLAYEFQDGLYDTKFSALLQVAAYGTPQEQYADIFRKYRNTDKWMKAPNGKPTNLTERQWILVRTPAFKAWFGDWENDPANASKVVDENGEPLVVYHGTESYGFSVFDVDGEGGGAAYFTDEQYATHIYAGNGGVYHTFLNIKKPISLSEMYDKYGLGMGDINEQFIAETKAKVDEIKANGYDGVIGDLIDANGNDHTGYIAFKPTQIKSATDNTGAFDRTNPDIRFEIGGVEHRAIWMHDTEKRNYTRMMLERVKKGETRDRLGDIQPGEWTGLATDINGRREIPGMVKFGTPKWITKDSPEYKDAYIEGDDKYDIKADKGGKWYYPVEDIRVFATPVTAFWNNSPRGTRFNAEDAVKFAEENGIAVNQTALPQESGVYAEGTDKPIHFSISAAIRGTGGRYDIDEETGNIAVYKKDGARVSKDNPFVVDDILTGDTPIANLFETAKYFIKGDKSTKLAQLYCDILNQAITYIDGMEYGQGNINYLEAVWKFAGSKIFYSVKANGDRYPAFSPYSHSHF